jgi:8-oxo-dGTP pyrophosphatase MutT (NUDIX family)
LKELLKGKIDYYQTEQHSDAANVSYKDVETEMTRRQADLYEGFWNRLPFMMRWKLRHRYDLSPEELLRFKSFMTGPRQVGLSDMPFRTDGNALKAFDDSGKLTAAFKSMQETLADPRRKGIAYSNFVDAGLKPYAAALDRAKIPYGMFSGDMNDQQRRDMVKAFNDGKLRVALVAPAGAEGISLKGSQKIQLLDPYWNDARMRQAQARGIRFDSHTGLPEDLRGVEVERYIAKLPLGLKGRLLAALGVDRESQRATVDDHLRAIAGRKERLNTQFLDLLKEIGTADRLPQSPVNRKGASVTIPGANRYPGAQEGQNVTEKKQPRVRVVMPHGDGQFLMETLSNPKYPERLGMTRFPGGGIEEGETPEQAAAREMREELGAEIDPKAFRSLGVIPHHQWGHDEHYLYLADHGLAPGVFDSAVGGDEQVHLTAGHPSGPKYFGADITSLLGKTSPTGPAQAGGAGLLAIKKIAAGPLSTASPADVYIIRGNPDADPENVGKYDAFYNNVKDHVSSLGYSAEFDSGLPNTVPPGGKFWLGHSRGGDRLRFAPQHGASALRLDDYEPDATRETQNAAYKKLFTQLGVARIADVPVSLRPKPGPEHYTYNDRMRAAVSRLLSTGKSAAYDIAGVGQRHMTVQSAGGADTMAALRMAKQYSDSARWQKKTQILRELMAGAGQDWTVDSDQGHTVGVTHVSGWKFHLPKSQISDLPLFSVWRANQRTA